MTAKRGTEGAGGSLGGRETKQNGERIHEMDNSVVMVAGKWV